MAEVLDSSPQSARHAYFKRTFPSVSKIIYLTINARGAKKALQKAVTEGLDTVTIGKEVKSLADAQKYVEGLKNTTWLQRIKKTFLSGEAVSHGAGGGGVGALLGMKVPKK